MNQRQFRLFIVGFLLSLTLQALFTFLSGHGPVTGGPPSELAETSRRLWRGESISQPEYYQLKFQLEQQSASDGKAYWQDVFALSRNGQLVPKHCILLSALAAPFYGIFGEAGFWLFNLLCALLLIASIYLVAKRLWGDSQAKLSALLCALGTQYFVHTYSFSYDLLAATLVLGGLACIESTAVWGSFLIVSSCIVRISCLVLAAPLLFVHFIFARKSQRFAIIMGSCAGLFLNCFINYLLWGEPFSTAYQHLPYFSAGTMQLDLSSHFISLSVLLSDWVRKLIGSDVGLILYNPALLLLPFALHKIFYSATYAFENRTKAVFYALAALAYSALTFSYSMWMLSSPGNRFLLPAIYILISLISVLAR